MVVPSSTGTGYNMNWEKVGFWFAVVIFGGAFVTGISIVLWEAVERAVKFGIGG